MKFKIVFLALIVSVLGFAPIQQAQAATTAAAIHRGGPFGLGVVIGEPSAITAKYDLDQMTAFDLGLAFNVSRWFLIYGDWQYKFAGAFSRTGAPELSTITPYIGVGPLLIISNSSDADTRGFTYYNNNTSKVALGIRVPLGLEWRPVTVPIGVFVEVAPGLTVLPGTVGFVQGGLGIRFYF